MYCSCCGSLGCRVWCGETSLNLTHDLPVLLSEQGSGCSETGLGRAPHSPRESMVQYGELAFWRVGQTSVPGPNAGFEKASLVPGCTRRAHDSVGRAALGDCLAALDASWAVGAQLNQ